MSDLRQKIKVLLAEYGQVDANACDRLIEEHDVNPIVVAIEINRVLEAEPQLRARHELARKLRERAHAEPRGRREWLDEFAESARAAGWSRADLDRVVGGRDAAPDPASDARPGGRMSVATDGTSAATAPCRTAPDREEDESRTRRRLLGAAAAVLVVLAVVLIAVTGDGGEVNPIEVSAWQRAQQRDTIAAYRGFIENFSGSAYAEHAQQRIAVLEGRDRAELQRGQELERQRIGEIRDLLQRLGYAPGSGDGLDVGLRTAIEAFADEHGLQTPVAVDSGLLDRLERTLQRVEPQRWQAALASDSVEALQRYLDDFPDGRFRQQAQERIRELEDGAARRERIRAIQRELLRLGRDVEVTGNLDPATRASLEAWRQATFQSGELRLDAALLDRLRALQRWPLQPGDTFSDCDLCPEMMVIAQGEFLMGSLESETMRLPNEGPVHRVRVGRFAMSRTEITFEQYSHCVADGRCPYMPPDDGWGRGRRPVINVSFEDAGGYARWLSERTGERYRLPSEAEWEYAARAGTQTRFHTGDCLESSQANFDARLPSDACPAGDFIGRTVEVGQYSANAFGLFDMHGNVREWTLDCWNPDYTGAPDDGSAWMRGDCGRAVVRGGAWRDIEGQVRSASRVRPSGEFHNNRTGFRVVREMGR